MPVSAGSPAKKDLAAVPRGRENGVNAGGAVRFTGQGVGWHEGPLARSGVAFPSLSWERWLLPCSIPPRSTFPACRLTGLKRSRTPRPGAHDRRLVAVRGLPARPKSHSETGSGPWPPTLLRRGDRGECPPEPVRPLASGRRPRSSASGPGRAPSTSAGRWSRSFPSTGATNSRLAPVAAVSSSSPTARWRSVPPSHPMLPAPRIFAVQGA